MVPKAREIMPRSAIVNGASPLTIRVAGTEPTPMKTRNAVPMNSAARRWVRVFSSSMGTSADSECLSTLSNVSRTLQLCFTADKVFCENLEPAAEIGGAKGTKHDPVGRPRDPRVDRPAGFAADDPDRVGDSPVAAGVDDARAGQDAGRARDGRAGARVEPLPAGAGRAPARQRLPRHDRAALEGGPMGRGPGSAHRIRGAHGGPS